MNESCLFTDMDNESLIYPALLKSHLWEIEKWSSNCIRSQFLLIMLIMIKYTGEAPYEIFLSRIST